MESHEYYEQLCTLAASGQLSLDEWAELNQHLRSCPDCETLIYDCGQIGFQILPLVADEYNAVPPPPGLAKRVIARANLDGMPLKGKGSRKSPTRDQRQTFVSRKVLFGAFTLSLVLAAIVATRYYDSRIQIDRRELHSASTERAPDPPAKDLLAENDRLKQESRKTEEQLRVTAEQIRKGKEDLESALRQRSVLESHLVSLDQTIDALTEKGATANADRTRLQQELQQLRSELESSRHELAVKVSEISRLRTEVGDLNARLGQQIQRDSALSRATELLANPNARVWRVDATNEDGKPEKAFGRILYVKNKGLVFFAYRLAEQKTASARISFYLWGENSGTKGSIKNLGLFHTEGGLEGWVVNCDDPTVLAKIDTVFITAEPSKNDATEPKGQRILAYTLDIKADQP